MSLYTTRGRKLRRNDNSQTVISFEQLVLIYGLKAGAVAAAVAEDLIQIFYAYMTFTITVFLGRSTEISFESLALICDLKAAYLDAIKRIKVRQFKGLWYNCILTRRYDNYSSMYTTCCTKSRMTNREL